MDCKHCGSGRTVLRMPRAGGVPYYICLDCGATQQCDDSKRTKTAEGTQMRLGFTLEDFIGRGEG